ncbi:hypothetical protein ACFX13_015716 [Malus domestica]
MGRILALIVNPITWKSPNDEKASEIAIARVPFSLESSASIHHDPKSGPQKRRRQPPQVARYFRRTLFSAAKSETSAAASAARSTEYNPLEEFFEKDRSQEEEKPVVYGRSWKAAELRLKSWDDLNKLWYVLLKEKNMLMTQRQMLHAQNLRFPNPERLPKVRKSMCRIKHVLTERAIEEPDPRRSAEMKRMINSL